MGPPDIGGAGPGLVGVAASAPAAGARVSLPQTWGTTTRWITTAVGLSTGGIDFHILEAGTYQVRPNSLSFPQLASADLPPFLAQWGQTDDATIILQFRDWVRQQLLSRPMPAPPATP